MFGVLFSLIPPFFLNRMQNPLSHTPSLPNLAVVLDPLIFRWSIVFKFNRLLSSPCRYVFFSLGLLSLFRSIRPVALPLRNALTPIKHPVPPTLFNYSVEVTSFTYSCLVRPAAHERCLYLTCQIYVFPPSPRITPRTPYLLSFLPPSFLSFLSHSGFFTVFIRFPLRPEQTPMDDPPRPHTNPCRSFFFLRDGGDKYSVSTTFRPLRRIFLTPSCRAGRDPDTESGGNFFVPPSAYLSIPPSLIYRLGLPNPGLPGFP